MLRWKGIAVSVLLLIAVAYAHSDHHDDESGQYVHKLTEENFDAMTAEEPWLLEFFAPWCGHCRKLAPIYEQAAMSLQGVMKLGTIDCTVEKRVAQRFGVRGYPTIKFYRDGEARDYRGSRDVDSIVRFAKIMTSPAVTTVDRLNIAQALTEYPVSFLYFGKEDFNYDVFVKVARKMQGLVQFLKTSDPALVKKYGVTVETAVVLITEGLENEVYDDQFNTVYLEKWILQRQFPLVSEIGMHNFDDITESGLFTVVAVVSDVTHYSTLEYLDLLRSVALQFRGQYHFGFIEATHWNRWLQSMGVSTEPENLPTLIVLNGPKEQYYLPAEKHSILSDSGIAEFLVEIQKGQVKVQGPSDWSPSRLIKKLDEWLTDNFTETQILVGISGVMGIFTLIMLWSMCSVTDAPATSEDGKADASNSNSSAGNESNSRKRKND